MGFITSKGPMPKRIGDCVIYPYEGKYLIRKKSGFTSQALKKHPKYAKSRENASNFGRLSREAKILRDPLKPYLPKRNAMQVFNGWNKKLHQLSLLDNAEPGKRSVFHVVHLPEVASQVFGYAFAPTSIILHGEFKKNTFRLFTSGWKRKDRQGHFGFRIIALQLNLESRETEVLEGDWKLYAKATLPKKINLTLPDEPKQGMCWCFLQTDLFQEQEGSFYPLGGEVQNLFLLQVTTPAHR